jgi:hypothetical protein
MILFLSLFLSLGIVTRLIYADPVPDFEFNQDNRLANNMLVYQDTPECKSLAEELIQMHPYDRKLATVTAEFHSAFFGSDPEEGECKVACLEIGSPAHLVAHVFPHHINSIVTPLDESYSWYQNKCQKKEVGFCNTQEGLVNVYWMNNDDERVWIGNVTTGERNMFWITSYVGHSFEVTDAQSGTLLGRYTVHFDSFFSFEKLEPFRSSDFVPPGFPDLTTAVSTMFVNEWERHSSVSRHFTGVGFNKGRLPKDLFRSMTTFYYNNHPYRIHELANRKGVFINWWESDVHYISMPFNLRVSFIIILYFYIYIVLYCIILCMMYFFKYILHILIILYEEILARQAENASRSMEQHEA